MLKQTKTLNIVKKVIEEYEFPEFMWVYCRPTLADLFKPEKRCGIYILRFTNDQFYVGQAVDVVRRFVQHVKIHDDIQEISFKIFQEKELDKVEQQLIKLLEQKQVKLRNINFTSFPKGDRDIDLIIPQDRQQIWLNSNHENILNEHIINHPDQQEKYSNKFKRLLKHAEFEIVKPFLIKYFKNCVLDPAKTELLFWCLTCLTKAFTNTNHLALCRLNYFWCEVLTIWIDDNKICNFTFHLTKSILTKSYLEDLKIKSLFIGEHFYQRGGPDQFMIEVIGIEDALKLFKR